MSVKFKFGDSVRIIGEGFYRGQAGVLKAQAKTDKTETATNVYVVVINPETEVWIKEEELEAVE